MKETTPKENIYSKLKLVNCLNNKMIDRLNSKYLSLGLQMKQIKVDKYGNELIGKDPKEIIGQKRDRKVRHQFHKGFRELHITGCRKLRFGQVFPEELQGSQGYQEKLLP